MKTLYERCQEVMPPCSGRATKLGVVASEGMYVTTEDGRKMLDFASGVAVNQFGHNHPEIVAAAKAQMDKGVHYGHNVLYYDPYVTLAEKLVEVTGGDTMVYFSNSGGEANDGAVKLAKFVTKRHCVIAFRNSFHGRTIGCSAITASNSKYRQNYDCISGIYFADYAYCYRCPFHQEKETCHMECVKQFDELFNKLVNPQTVAAMILEPVQGEGGYIVPPKEFLQGLREICTKHGIMLIFDEVQAGNGRCGEYYAHMAHGVTPDIFTTAKALGGGFPLSAVIAKKEIMQMWEAGAHGGTFGGNPIACAAGLAVFKLLENGGLENCKKMGAYFMQKLADLQKKYPEVIGDVRGLGLMIGIEMVKADKSPNTELAGKILADALDNGIILLNAGFDKNVVRFIAPIIVTEKEIDKVVESIEGTLQKNK